MHLLVRFGVVMEFAFRGHDYAGGQTVLDLPVVSEVPQNDYIQQPQRLPQF